MLNRRKLLHLGSQTLAAGLIARVMPAQPATGTLLPHRTGSPVPLARNFLGLGYEMSSVATPGLLSSSNAPYVQLIRQLGPHGVLRVGGIVADYTRYQTDGTALFEPKNTVITAASLRQLAAFLKITGWTLIWSLNFAQGSLEDAITEARAVSAVLGPSLEAIELGNEVENYGNGAHSFRPAPYTFAQYHAEYTRWRAALLQAVPGLRFAAPDTAASIPWVEQMAASAHNDVQLLTTHYYRGDQHKGNAEQLLRPDLSLKANLLRLREASIRSGIPWRMCETNSLYGGGRPGVSDTFTGALWTLDFLLLLAINGCAGVNLETGVNQLGFVSSYSPIQDDGKGHNTAGVPYYGMLAFAHAAQGCTHLLPLQMQGAPDTLTVYALGIGEKVHSVVAVHRGNADVSISLSDLGIANGTIARLTAPALDSKSDIGFAGTQVSAEGHWVNAGSERLRTSNLELPQGSAAVVRVSEM